MSNLPRTYPNNNTDNTSPSSSPNKSPNLGKDIMRGLTAGAATSLAFAPYDRAMYLAISHNRLFLNVKNFVKPYHGFQQVLLNRSISSGMYYIMQGSLNDYFYPYLRHQLQFSENSAQFLVGAAAGCLSGILTNGLSTIKYYTWGDTTRTFRSSLSYMYTTGGIKPFMRGMPPTAMRDMVFGCVYEVLRHKITKDATGNNPPTDIIIFTANLMAASAGTLITSPLNYARNLQYATHPSEPTPTMLNIWKKLKNEAKQLPPQSRPQFYSGKLQFGPGLFRVALGATVSQYVVDNCDKAVDHCLKYVPGN